MQGGERAARVYVTREWEPGEARFPPDKEEGDGSLVAVLAYGPSHHGTHTAVSLLGGLSPHQVTCLMNAYLMPI